MRVDTYKRCSDGRGILLTVYSILKIAVSPFQRVLKGILI